MGDNSGENSLLIHYRTQGQELTITQSDNVSFKTEGIFDYLQREIERRNCSSDDLPFDFNCGFVGYFGYELKAESGGKFNHTSAFLGYGLDLGISVGPWTITSEIIHAQDKETQLMLERKEG